MISHIRKFRDQLAAGRCSLGAGVTFSDPAVSEALANVVDFLWIDLEHNPIDLGPLLGHLMAARAGGAPSLVRVPSSETSFLKRVIDTGAEGVICPQVRCADEVRRFVSACRYPPKGTRGWGPRRPTHYGEEPLDEYLADAEALFVCVQIEHVDAVRDIDAILAVDGLDSIVFGPNDLSGSMNRLCHYEDPEIGEILRNVSRKAREAGVFVGSGLDADVDSAVWLAEKGVQWLQCGCDFSYMMQAAKDLLARTREALTMEPGEDTRRT